MLTQPTASPNLGTLSRNLALKLRIKALIVGDFQTCSYRNARGLRFGRGEDGGEQEKNAAAMVRPKPVFKV